MSRVLIKKGIGYGESSRSAFIDMAAVSGTVAYDTKPFPETKPDPSTDRSTVWAKWGSNNLLPQDMTNDIETCGILNSIIDGKARFAINNGILPALVHYEKNGQMVIDDIIIESEIDEFLEDNNHFFHCFGWMKDQCGFANSVARLGLTRNKTKIGIFQRDDITEMRYEKMNQETGIIERIFLSAEWKRVGNNINDNRIQKIPLLSWNNPLHDLRERVKGGSNHLHYALTNKYPSWGKKYYATPLWYAAMKWVKIAQGVPEMKAAMFEHNFRPKYMVVISEKFWQNKFNKTDTESKNWEDYTEEERDKKKQEVFDDIDKHLAGNENAYKTIFVDGWYDQQTGKVIPEIQIIAIEDPTKAGELLPDSAAANSEIAFAMLFNPAIMGASMPSGPYTNSQGGSNVRESTLIQVIIHELERQNVRRIFNVIKRFNGWDKSVVKNEKQKLEFIIPATIPTTLDTGSNVKPMVTGVSDPKNEKAA